MVDTVPPVSSVADDPVSVVGPLVSVVALVSVPLIDPPVLCEPILPVGVSVALAVASVTDVSVAVAVGLVPVPGVVTDSEILPLPLSPQPN
jgi:hypothetical protein